MAFDVLVLLFPIVLAIHNFDEIALIVMRTSLGDSAAAIIRYALLGAITIPLAVGVFLLIGYGTARLRARVGSL
jgi:hypothetical protein